MYWVPTILWSRRWFVHIYDAVLHCLEVGIWVSWCKAYWSTYTAGSFKAEANAFHTLNSKLYFLNVFPSVFLIILGCSAVKRARLRLRLILSTHQTLLHPQTISASLIFGGGWRSRLKQKRQPENWRWQWCWKLPPLNPHTAPCGEFRANLHVTFSHGDDDNVENVDEDYNNGDHCWSLIRVMLMNKDICSCFPTPNTQTRHPRECSLWHFHIYLIYIYI